MHYLQYMSSSLVSGTQQSVLHKFVIFVTQCMMKTMIRFGFCNIQNDHVIGNRDFFFSLVDAVQCGYKLDWGVEW